MGLDERIFAMDIDSPSGVGAWLREPDVLPRERAPYILSRVALSLYSRGDLAGHYAASEAFKRFSEDNSQLEPPLPDDLHSLLSTYRESKRYDQIRRFLDEVGVILLASALDFGSRPATKPEEVNG